MKQKILTIAVLFILSMNLSYASENDQNANTGTENDQVTCKHQMPDNGENNITAPSEIKENNKVTKSNAVKRFFKKSKKRLFEKFNMKKLLSPQKVIVLMIIGFLIMLPGMILAALGVALIPAIILAVVGGTLVVVGVLVGG